MASFFTPKTENNPNLSRRLDLIQDLSERLFSSQTVEELISALILSLSNLISLESIRLCLLDNSENNIEQQLDWDFESPKAISTLTQTQFAESDRVIAEFLKYQAKSLPVLNPKQDNLICLPVRGQSTLILPIIQQNKLLGVLGLGFGGKLTQVDPLFLDVQRLFALALSNTQLYHQLNQQIKAQQLINAIRAEIRQSLDLPVILQTTATALQRYLNVDSCLIHFWQTPQTVKLPFNSPAAAQTAQANTQTGLNLTAKEQEALHAFEKQLFDQRASGQAQFNPFVFNSLDPEIKVLENITTLLPLLKSYALFPILSENKTLVGIIGLYQFQQARAWLEADLEMVASTAAYLVLALNQANLYQQTQNQKLALERTLSELKSTQVQLIQSEKMAVLGQFVAGIAHEVNTPLGAVMSNEETLFKLLAQGLETPDALLSKLTTCLSLLQTNQEATKRILDIVQNLRNFARLDESDLKEVDIHEGIDSTLRILKHRLDETQAKITKQFGTLPKLWCFAGLLNQVFQNLLVNSLQATPADQTPQISITTQPLSPQRILIRFEDNGKGIDQSALDKVFDPGFTTKGVGVGTGLGLAICFNIIQKHLGDIRIQNGPQQGVIVEIELPLNLKEQLENKS